MAKCKIDLAVTALNAKRGLKYPDIGYMYYANIAGDGRKYRSLYTIINAGGGVSYSEFNGKTTRETLKKLNNQLR